MLLSKIAASRAQTILGLRDGGNSGARMLLTVSPVPHAAEG